jgi:hypothetical protein
MMNGPGKSDRPVVPEKSPNKAGQPVALLISPQILLKGPIDLCFFSGKAHPDYDIEIGVTDMFPHFSRHRAYEIAWCHTPDQKQSVTPGSCVRENRSEWGLLSSRIPDYFIHPKLWPLARRHWK